MNAIHYKVEQSSNNIVFDALENQQNNLVYHHDCNFDTTTDMVVRASKNSATDVYCIITNSGKADITIDVQLIGAGSQVNIYGVYILSKQQGVNIITQQNHTVAYASSSVTFNGVLADSAQLRYKGTIVVEKRAHNTQAEQNNKTILLSKQTQAQSIPSLEVLNNDVQCAHGSAIGQLDEQQVWYAQTRGLTKKKATQILLSGFLGVKNTEINSLVKQKIEQLII